MNNDICKVKTEDELVKAIKNNEDYILLEKGLDGTIKSILITGRICWGIVLGSIAVSITAIIASAPTGGISNVAHIVTAPIAITTIGSSAAISATTIAMKAGSIKILSKLRKYRIVRETNEGMIIARY